MLSLQHTSILTLRNIIQHFSSRSGATLNNSWKEKGKQRTHYEKQNQEIVSPYLTSTGNTHWLNLTCFYFFVCSCLWLTGTALGVLILRLQINISKQEILQIFNPQIVKISNRWIFFSLKAFHLMLGRWFSPTSKKGWVHIMQIKS